MRRRLSAILFRFLRGYALLVLVEYMVFAAVTAVHVERCCTAAL